jgi:ABC-type branched-subunit amino acid transport system ATPase component
MDKLQLKGLTKKFGNLVVVDDLNLTLRAGEFVSLLGPQARWRWTAGRCRRLHLHCRRKSGGCR